MSLDGLLVIDKPEGPTSHDVVARVRRLLRIPGVGHTGTLDPMATGVLPLVLGKATRLARFLTSDAKRYQAEVRLGWATDTYDRLGEQAGDAVAMDITREAVEGALTAFRGEITQTPPPYSAKKIGGVSAHRLARRGEAVTPAPVRMTVHHLELLDFSGDRLTLDVHSSAGFYVRSLAHDLGAALGCGAHLTALRRTASGDWTLAHAIPLADCERDVEAMRARVVPMPRLLTGWPAVTVTQDGERRVRHGQPLRPADMLCTEIESLEAQGPSSDLLSQGAMGEEMLLVRVLNGSGALLAIAQRRPDGLLHPGLVLV
jgi:tRNA pseudouridine55 synthase